MARSNGHRQQRSYPSVERMEERRLLSVYTGFSNIRPVVTRSAVYQITVTGGGYEEIRSIGRGVIDIKLVGTTSNSTLAINVVRTRGHFTNGVLGIGKIDVRSGQLGAIKGLGTADLLGPVTPINNSMSAIEFDGIGPNAKIDVNGALGKLTVGNNVDLNPSGHINVAGSLAGPLQVGGVLLLDGGQIHIGGDVGSGSGSGGGGSSGLNLSELVIQRGGQLTVGRDVLTPVTVNGDLILDSNGNLTVGRNLNGLTVNGNIIVTPSGGAISVGGNLLGLTVNGDFQGKGTSTADLNVGLNLQNLTVLGGGANQGGLQKVNFNIGKDLIGLNVPHGIFNSLITAGVLIDGAGQGGAGGNVGPDGTSAIFDSQLRAGVEINNLTINGDVTSDYPTNPNPTGYPTRIVAGEDRQGNFFPGGNIDHFQITGSLIDAVIAASVKPNGGTGTLPTTGYNSFMPPSNAPGDGGANTYDKPAGTVAVGTFAANTPVPNYTELSYFNETLTGVAYDPSDPTIDDAILGGAVNKSFASTPAVNSNILVSSTSGSASGSSGTQQTVPAPLALPTTSTVLGGVVSTPHGDQFDYAGIFAADTSGVFIGPIPKQL